MREIFLTAAIAVLASQGPNPPQAPRYEPILPEGAERYESAKYTQSIAVVDGRDEILQVPIAELPDKRWLQSGGMQNVKVFKSEKYKTIPKEGKVWIWIGNISVRNSLGYMQDNRGLLREWPEGARFDDVLKNSEGVVFEHRAREKIGGKWKSTVVYSDEDARPPGYDGLKVTCAECHSRVGQGAYNSGLVPGSDGVFSVPLPWSLLE